MLTAHATTSPAPSVRARKAQSNVVTAGKVRETPLVTENLFLSPIPSARFPTVACIAAIGLGVGRSLYWMMLLIGSESVKAMLNRMGSEGAIGQVAPQENRESGVVPCYV